MVSPDLYRNEATESSYVYPEDYPFKPAFGKLLALSLPFPDLDGSKVDILSTELSRQTPLGTEELLVCPKPSLIAGNYHEALVNVLELLGKTRNLKNQREGWLNSPFMELSEKTAEAIAKLERKTAGDYLVIPVQMGMRHRGRSVRRARECFIHNEFGLGPYEVVCYLL
ncbi:hypothetical protein IID23_00605, partial [Patescibacteria group bacterium]|nr:hypothetical protein [Patescibacteria group bacterium]